MTLKNKLSLFTSLASPFLLSSLVNAESLISESFTQIAGDLGGQAGGAGLNNWATSSGSTTIAPATLSYGDLPNSGGQAVLASSGNTSANVTTTTVLADNNLLDDGATLWFSMIISKENDGGSNEHGGFAFGTAPVLAAFNGERMFGYGVGFELENTAIIPGTWNGDSETNTGISKGSGLGLGDLPSTFVVIGEITWGATEGDEETITIYLPSSDLTTLGTGSSKTVAGFDQTAINTIGMAQRNSGGTITYDEIRFGASLEDVISGTSTPPTPLALSITPSATTVGNFDFSWETSANLDYDLVSSTDLATNPNTWPVWDSNADIEGTGETIILTDVTSGDPKRFFAIVQKTQSP